MTHGTVKRDNLNIFYREVGLTDAPATLLLHGFSTSSQLFRNLILALSDEYRPIAPDNPSYGYSSMPLHDQFAYTFANLVRVIDEFTEVVRLTNATPDLVDFLADLDI